MTAPRPLADVIADTGFQKPERRDKRGRKIGFNWWREYNTTVLQDADHAWQALRESGQLVHGSIHDTAYYQLDDDEYRALHPRPTLKAFLIANAGLGRGEVY